MPSSRKKLIEVALPLEAINVASAREKSIRHGHPSTLHLWWARRPLAAARAVIFAQMVDDPGSVPEEFPTEEAQNAERQRLFRIIEDLVVWENTTNERVLEAARAQIRRSWEREAPGQPLPAFHDPFAGGGALPLEAQRLGLEAYASDLNPVAVMINKAMIEIPPKFAGRPPVNPEARKKIGGASGWPGASGLAEDVRYYGAWMREEAQKRIGHLYPTVKAVLEKDGTYRHATPAEIKKQSSKIEELTVIAWLWARTVESPNPAYRGCHVPLITTFWLSTKKGKETWLEPVLDGKTYRFEVHIGTPKKKAVVDAGTKLARGANFRCILSDTPMAGDYIKAEGMAGRMGARLLALVADSEHGRVYLPATEDHEVIAQSAQPNWEPEGSLVEDARAFTPHIYGLKEWRHLFTHRQLVALTTFSELVTEALENVKVDAARALKASDADNRPLANDGIGPTAYAEAISVYLAFGMSRFTMRSSSLASWDNAYQKIQNTFGRQALPMVWDFCEGNPFSTSTGNFESCISGIVEVLEFLPLTCQPSSSTQIDAQQQQLTHAKLVSTDPPYYDNIGYADLSDFFYVWLRRPLQVIFPALFSTLAVPKAEELVATPYRHGGKNAAEKFFMDGMTRAMQRLADQAHPSFPVTIYYAFKQAESGSEGTASTGWETFLEAVIQAGFSITGTWPMRTEMRGRVRDRGESNALASSIVLVCRHRPANTSRATRREYLNALQRELPAAMRHLQEGNIAPVDLAQASIGPGMGVFTRYSQVLESDGQPLSVRTALQLINQTLDEALAELENDFDGETRWALAWFEQMGFNDGAYGEAETLSKAKNTAVNALQLAGVVQAKSGKVRLLRVDELPADWNPATDKRLTAWETVHHLIRLLESGGEVAAATLAAQLGPQAETARELAYRLYNLCERKKRTTEAQAYNGLVLSWPEIARLAQARPAEPGQSTLL